MIMALMMIKEMGMEVMVGMEWEGQGERHGEEK
jgi:hypothetical protein